MASASGLKLLGELVAEQPVGTERPRQNRRLRRIGLEHAHDVVCLEQIGLDARLLRRARRRQAKKMREQNLFL